MVLLFGREGHGGSGLKEFGVRHLDGSVGGIVDQVPVLIVPINLKEYRVNTKRGDTNCFASLSSNNKSSLIIEMVFK